MPTGRYRELLAWQHGMDLVRAVYRVTRRFPPAELFGLASQMQRAAVSIPANLAEGHTRGTSKDFLKYVIIAHASLAEFETLLTVAQDTQYIGEGDAAEITQLCDATGKMLGGLRRKLISKTATKRR